MITGNNISMFVWGFILCRTFYIYNNIWPKKWTECYYICCIMLNWSS